jgi:hypothetical protein
MAEPIETVELDVPVFRAGSYHDGAAKFSQADVEQIAATYDPDAHQAPNAIGHEAPPSGNAPAYGWVQKLYLKGDELWANLQQVPKEFVEWIKAGAWKKRSVEIYDEAHSPIPGKKYLRRLVWLGAQPPEVKGLADAVFDDSGIDFTVINVTNHEESAMDLNELYTKLKEHFTQKEVDNMAEKETPKETPAVLSLTPEQLNQMVTDAATKAVAQATTSFAEQVKLEVDAKVQAAITPITQQARSAAIRAFCENLRQGGLAPALVDPLPALLEKIDYTTQHQFGEAKATLAQQLEGYITNLVAAVKGNSAVVPLGELAGANKSSDPAAEAMAAFAENESQYKRWGLTPEQLRDPRIVA